MRFPVFFEPFSGRAASCCFDNRGIKWGDKVGIGKCLTFPPLARRLRVLSDRTARLHNLSANGSHQPLICVADRLH